MRYRSTKYRMVHLYERVEAMMAHNDMKNAHRAGKGVRYCAWCGDDVAPIDDGQHDFCSSECLNSFEEAMRDRAVDTAIEEMREKERE